MSTELLSVSLGYLLIAFAFAAAWAPLLIGLLYKYKLVRSHSTDFTSIIEERYEKVGTPIMGGLLVVITYLMFCLFFLLRDYNSCTGQSQNLFIGCDERILLTMIALTISSLLGGIDDILNIFGTKRKLRTVKKQIKLAKVHKSFLKRIWLWITLPWTTYQNIWYALGSYPGKGLQAGEKIIIQILTGGFVAWWIYFRQGIDTLWLPWFGEIYIGWGIMIIALIAVVTMTNAVNISDGMDGLSSGLLIPSFITFLVLAIVEQDKTLTLLNAVSTGALFAYIYFNIKPARFEMGDAGSLALGSLLATIALLQQKVILLPIAGFMFIAIIGSSLIQGIYRRIFGKRLFKMAPLHLHFQIKGWSEEKIVMRFWLFAALFAILGIWLGLQ